MAQLLILVFVAVFAYVAAQDPEGCTSYYKSQVPDVHTMCKYSPQQCKTGAEKIRFGGLTDAEMKEIVDHHNALRAQLVAGSVPGQPKAMKMREMVWDTELAKVAQRLADACIFEHDKNRNLPGGDAVGQNIALSYGEKTNTTAYFMQDANQQWWDEYKLFNSATDFDPFVFKMTTGHYTAMAWADTFKIGCGFSMFNDPSDTGASGMSTKIYVCNYFPAGNVAGQLMYVRKS